MNLSNQLKETVAHVRARREIKRRAMAYAKARAEMLLHGHDEPSKVRGSYDALDRLNRSIRAWSGAEAPLGAA